MSKDRALCKFYICAHKCSKGKDAEVQGLCRTCPKYESAHRPIREDTSRRRKERAARKDTWD